LAFLRSSSASFLRVRRVTRPTIAALLGSALLAAASANAASLFDPALRFRQLPTEHFVIYFHQGEEGLARRLAAIAEDSWRALRPPLGVVPPPLTHVVLADQTELWNGYATPLPRDTIVLYAVWPRGSDLAFDDWLRIAFTHEFTHIVHLDRSEGWARGLRAVFGRTRYGFPNLFLPAWQIEGLATYEESAITGKGRLHAGDFRGIVAEAAAAGRLEPLDRVNGGLTDWPDDVGIYAYGLGFHAYLVERFGADTLATLAASTARSLPFTGSRAFQRVYGQSLGALWREYQISEVEHTVRVRIDTGLTRLTHRGFSVSAPRFDPFVCPTCPAEIVYSASDAHGFPGLYRVGAGGGAPRRLTNRYLGSTTGVAREALYFDQLQRHRNIGLYGDLYAFVRATGRVRPLTSGARLLDPDVSPDGGTIVCVQDHPDRRDLVLVRLTASAKATAVKKRDTTYEAASITPLLSEADTHFNAPRWSPDGRRIAVERHRIGSLPDVIVVDVATRAVDVVASDANARIVSPAWRPDGTAIVAAVATHDETFNLHEFAIDGSRRRQLTHTSGGATWPDVSPDGKMLVFVGYTPDGYDVFSMPYPSAEQDVTASVPSPPAGDSSELAPDLEGRPSTPYAPLSTLAPTSWTPVVEGGSVQWRIGAAVTGYDVLGYHVYAATATWRISSPEGAPTPARATPDWQLYYAYARWRPAIFGSASAETSFFAGPATDAGTPTALTLRARELQAGVILPIVHVRVSHQALVSLVHALDQYTLPTQQLSRTRVAIRGAWLTSSARSYGYSISPEDGVSVGATTEIVRRGLGAFEDANVVTGDIRAYLPSFAPHHVAAVRIAAGISSGDVTAGRTFLLGGPSSNSNAVDFGRHAVSLLRGFTTDTFAGSRVALVNADYRWPIARPQRGVGTWPLLFHTAYAAVFADAGHAWTRAFHADAIKVSAGGELSADVVAAYFIPFSATVGAAWGHDGSGLVRDGATVYFRVGRAF
jgi:Tol biopolymer transport system component